MLKVETPKPLPPETKAPPAPPTKGKSRYDLTIPDIGVGKEVKGGFGEGSYRGKFKGVKEEEQASGQGRSDSGDALLAQAGTAAQAPAESPVQFGIPELMRTEAPDNGASRFAELSRIAGTKAARGDRAGALAEADAMIKLQPWNAEARLYKANLLNGVRRFAEAEAAAREAVRLDPENAEAWKAMGWAQLHQRKFAEAEKALSRAINLLEARRAAGEDTEELRNALASAYAMRAFAYEGLGRRDKLIADLERASQLDPARFTRHLADARAGKTIFDPDAEDTWTLLSALPEAPGSPAPARGLLVAGGLAALAAGVLLALGAWAVALFKKKRARGPADLAAAMAGGGPPKEGDVLAGKYRLAGFVGRDAAGERWEAVDAALNRTVSVRRLDPGDDPQARERMRQESRTAAGLQHPNIVAVFEALDLPNGVFLVMEHVPGRSVAEMLATGGPLPLGRVRRILEAAAAALVYARAQGVVHPGLKPSSLVVTDGGAVKVRDFASAAGGLGGDDLRALGECLYEMLTGEPLDAGAGRFAQGSRWPSQVRPGVPPAADALVLGAISADPGERFGGVAEFVEGLSALGPPES